MDMLINLIVGIISQCTCILKSQVVHLKYTIYIYQFYLNKALKEEKKKCRISALTLGLLIQNVSFYKISK